MIGTGLTDESAATATDCDRQVGGSRFNGIIIDKK